MTTPRQGSNTSEELMEVQPRCLRKFSPDVLGILAKCLVASKHKTVVNL